MYCSNASNWSSWSNAFVVFVYLYKQTVYLKLYFNNNNTIKILFINILNKQIVLLKIILTFQKCFQTSFHKHKKITNDPELLAETLLYQRHAKLLLPNPPRAAVVVIDNIYFFIHSLFSFCEIKNPDYFFIALQCVCGCTYLGIWIA